MLAPGLERLLALRAALGDPALDPLDRPSINAGSISAPVPCAPRSPPRARPCELASLTPRFWATRLRSARSSCSSAASKSTRECTGSPCETSTRSNGSSSMARNAGSTRSSCHGVPQMRRTPPGAVIPSANTSARCSAGTQASRASTAVVEGDEPAGQRVPGLDPLQLGPRCVAAPEQERPVTAGAEPAGEQVDVADVVERTTATAGGAASRRSHTSRSQGGGARGSITMRSPCDSTKKDETSGSHCASSSHPGCGWRQSQRPRATSSTSIIAPELTSLG